MAVLIKDNRKFLVADQAIERITNHYTGTDFYWMAKPRHWRDSWRVKIAEVELKPQLAITAGAGITEGGVAP